MAGEFFSLTDELSASERRLDEMAKPILAKTAAVEKRAAAVIALKDSRLDASMDYLNRLDGTVAALEVSEKPTNGGPIVEGSAVLPPPSPEQPPPSPVVPVAPPVAIDQRPERQPSDYKVTNGPGV